MSEDEESQVCAKCHEHYSMDAPDMEPTKFCDDCAHDVAEEATAECEKLKAELEHVQKQAAAMRSCLEHIKTLSLECREDPKIVLQAVGLSAIGALNLDK